MLDAQDLFERRLPAIYSFLNIPSYPVEELSEASLQAFKLSVDALWTARLEAFQKARTEWAKAHLDTLRAKGVVAEAKLLEVEKLRAVFDSTYAEMLNGRRAEELTRALPHLYSGDEALMSWFEVQLAGVEAYTPHLPK